ncbi:hypothetical protein Pint_29388 [Pistacia integerrima]|uniref:Uncharacterized protein n=1 Tax=Pistacia integerrima TaxID=434235 RepID=A0ACC0WZM7_9ROSI|nr:hypothetical protein Pint_29388 [Pistacia integerrima]
MERRAQSANLPILPPHMQPGAHQFTDGTNFASAGAGVLDAAHPGTIHLKLQLSYFKDVEKSLKQKLGDKEAKKVSRNAVYLFSIGGNDYFSFSSMNRKASQSSKGQYVKSVNGSLTSVLTVSNICHSFKLILLIQLHEIYHMGGRKIAFQNAGKLGCLPMIKSLDPTLGSACSEAPSSLARLRNRYLAVILKKLQPSCQDSNIPSLITTMQLVIDLLTLQNIDSKRGRPAAVAVGLTEE